MAKNYQSGLKGLLAQGTQARDNKPASEVQEAEGKKKPVCYTIPSELEERIRYIAYYDRKKINTVVIEAFEKYVSEWKPATQPDAKLPR